MCREKKLIQVSIMALLDCNLEATREKFLKHIKIDSIMGTIGEKSLSSLLLAGIQFVCENSARASSVVHRFEVKNN